ncbi:hypothetical protein C7B64_10105 [Merismopedia glauca CCAP 1448/3]|uniref:Uncharacterized protein n=1 Tax=Merismopedia glauca CCAP 1448/3 TaxID=1296344 RepID=A0A2T1C4A8_9CYAN|nr:hypothetical protein C7B64_10105 [Merismopedia glauca CCAP 1448/3]
MVGKNLPAPPRRDVLFVFNWDKFEVKFSDKLPHNLISLTLKFTKLLHSRLLKGREFVDVITNLSGKLLQIYSVTLQKM